MDYRIFHAVDEFSFDYKWLAHATYAFETFGVVVYAAAVLFLWLLTPPGSERRWKIAALCGGVSALISLGINQLIGDFIWHRPRPYESHPAAYHLTQSHDPSFPSDHASAAFGIAVAVAVLDPLAGAIFLVLAVLIAIGRVVVGEHYPGDVIAGAAIGTVSALVVIRLARPVIALLVRVVERATDPLLAMVWRRRAVDR